MELIFNPCGELQWNPEGTVNQIHCSHLHAGGPGIFSDLLWSFQMLEREWGAESNGKLPHLIFPSKTAILLLQFAVKGLLLDRTEALVPEFAVKDLPLGRKLWWRVFLSYFLDLVFTLPQSKTPPGPKIQIPLGQMLVGVHRLWTRTLDRYTRSSLPESVRKPGPPPETTEARTQRTHLQS